MTPKIEQFVSENDLETPFLAVDLDVVDRRYADLRRVLPDVDIFYAVKANPAPEIVALLAALGSSFDAASPDEIQRCLNAGVAAEQISYGITLKKERHIAWAYERGVRLFAFDSVEELDKIAIAAPRARVYCRIETSNGGADWPLSGKFGCSLEMACNLMVKAQERGLEPHGISFHVGSQQTQPEQWAEAITRAGKVYRSLASKNIHLHMINIGGGFPVPYREAVQPIEAYADAIERALTAEFGQHRPRIITEPGRFLVGEAGVLFSEVILVSSRDEGSDLRWVYLDVGKFGGLAETADEAIRYAFHTPHDGSAEGRVTIAGPTCDGLDVLYEKTPYTMPLALTSGDVVRIHSAGAYTTMYASIGFNGFAPIIEHYI